jgi:hypothetical protein
MFDRFFNDEPAQTWYEQAARVAGTLIGAAVFVALAWITLEGMF